MGVEKIGSISRMRFSGSMLEDGIRPLLGLILIVGGQLIMMGQHDRSESVLLLLPPGRSGSEIRFRDQVPETTSCDSSKGTSALLSCARG